MSDGSRLRQSWAAALNNAETQFRSLLVSANSSSWKRVPLPPSQPQRGSTQTILSNGKGKGRPISTEGIVMHRRATKQGDVTRVVLDAPFEGSIAGLDKWRAVLSTPELREEWDPAVEASSLVEMFDWNTRITRTNFALGWPANPRDAVTISKTFHDATTLIDISTSLPRSSDEPAYLRPAPPYVRSDVHLFAWCIQIHPSKSGTADGTPLSPSTHKLRITCIWQHDLKAVWSLSSSLSQQLPAMVQGIIRVVQKRGHRIPLLCAYGTGISLERMSFELGRESLNVEYSVIVEDEDEDSAHSVKGLEQVNEAKAKKRLERTIEYILPDYIGWDIQLTARGSSDAVSALPWKTTASRAGGDDSSAYLTLHVRHSSMPDTHSVLKVRMTIELSGSLPGLRFNGLPHPVTETASRDPTSYTLSQQMLQDASSVSGLSFQSLSTGQSSGAVSNSSGRQRGVSLYDGRTSRSSGAEKMILTRVKRNYIYFSSLLQEPEAKWKRNSESRGVTICQLDSIDPTLVVYRAEAVFVGVGLWDLYSTIASPGARVQWDKTYEDAVLMDDVNELTELWHWRTKPNWPANARDVILLKTVYKSPTTLHVFSFSTDDNQLFPSIPSSDPSVIRTQVDLQGWAIETLSPTTTLLTLLEQSDPRGWAGKSSIPQQMINAVAGIGEFAIKYGGPPINTRLGGARSLSQRYDHEKGSFRLEYEGCESRRSTPNPLTPLSPPLTAKENPQGDGSEVPSSPSIEFPPSQQQSPLTYIECEIRCDLDTWASSLDVVIDPPPQTVSCLRRHRLSNRGGGLWLTIAHDAVFVGEDRLLVIVRKGTSKEKGAVVINGTKVKIDIEELPESEIKTLTKMKRVKPARFPLDQPPVLGVIRRRREQWDEENGGNKNDEPSTPKSGFFNWNTSTPQISSPLTKFWTRAIEQTTATTTAAVNAATSTLVSGTATENALSPDKPPMINALAALAFLKRLHADKSGDGWTIVNDKGFPVHKKLYPEISTSVPVHKGEKVIEGVSAEEIAHIINNYESRTTWDDRFDSAVSLQEFGADSHTAFIVCKGGFPFRDRGFYVANLTARLLRPSESPAASREIATSPHPHSTTIFCASASFNPASVASFDSSKYNPHNLPIGRIMIQGWILETLDPYTTENYAIPSTRCTHVVSIDFAGSVPVAYNSMLNANQPRIIPAVEQYMKGHAALPLMRLPASSMALIPEDASLGVGEPEQSNLVWVLERKDEKRALISTKYKTSSKKFRATVLLSVPHNTEETNTPRPSSSALPPVDNASSDNLTPMASPMHSPTSTIRSRRVSGSASTLKPGRSVSRDLARSTSSIHAMGGTISPDLLIGELVVDSKLYPDGYVVKALSQLKDPKRHAGVLSSSSIPSACHDLPIVCSCHILPSTPLHSSGLNMDAPPRHLLRFTLPTSVYEVPADEPLSLSVPERPEWLTVLEAHGALVELSVQPSEQKSNGLVYFDDLQLDIMGEKDSIPLLRRELEDERIGKMPTLSRIPFVAGAEELPKQMVEPIAVARDLFDDKTLVGQSVGTNELETEDKGESQNDKTIGDDARLETTVSLGTPIEGPDPLQTSSMGLFKFFNDYQNTLFRRNSSQLTVKDLTLRPASRGSSSPSAEGPLSNSVATQSHSADTRLYPLSTLLIIALISFLLGSFMRSLLTPADFIYLSPDLNELQDDRWREIKRLVEFKRVFGGWDFLIGIVRRH